MLALGALEYAVLAPAAMICAVVLLFGTGGHVQHAMTYPWLAVIPGFLAALWVSSPKRAARLSDPGDGGRLRQWFAHAVAGICKLRCLLTRAALARARRRRRLASTGSATSPASGRR